MLALPLTEAEEKCFYKLEEAMGISFRAAECKGYICNNDENIKIVLKYLG